MKKALVIFAVAFTSVLSAATVSWQALGGSITSGEAYLVQQTSATTSIEAIRDALIDSGTKAEADCPGYKKWDLSTNFSSDPFTGESGVTGSVSIDAATENASNYFVVILDGNGGFEISSTFQDITFSDSTTPTPGLNSLAFSSYYKGTLGENVPEPTVLALLALGVAGVALRRKKVVA